VVRLVREHGLNARKRGKRIPTTNSSRGFGVCANLLNGEFAAERDGEQWVSSYQRYAITYPRTAGGWVYLTTVLDRYDRQVIGWAFSAGLETAHTVSPVLDMAFVHRAALPFGPRGAVLRSSFSGPLAGALPHGPPEHEPEGKPLRPSPAPNHVSKR
jgi:transposase InsO family protein